MEFYKNPDGSIYTGKLMTQKDFEEACCQPSGGDQKLRCCSQFGAAWGRNWIEAENKYSDVWGWQMGSPFNKYTELCYPLIYTPGWYSFGIAFSHVDNSVIQCQWQGIGCKKDCVCSEWGAGPNWFAECVNSGKDECKGQYSSPGLPSVDMIQWYGTGESRQGYVVPCSCPPCIVLTGKATKTNCKTNETVTVDWMKSVSLKPDKDTVQGVGCAAVVEVNAGAAGTFSLKVARASNGANFWWEISLTGSECFVAPNSKISGIFPSNSLEGRLYGLYPGGMSGTCQNALANGKDCALSVWCIRVNECASGPNNAPNSASAAAASMQLLSGDDVTKTEAQQLFLNAEAFNALPSDQRAEVSKLAFQDGGIQTTASGDVVENNVPAEPVKTVLKIPDNAIETCLHCADPSCPNITICCGGQVNVQIRTGCMKNLWKAEEVPVPVPEKPCDDAALQQTLATIQQARTPGDAAQRAEVEAISNAENLQREQDRFVICTSADADGKLCPHILGTAGAYCKKLWPTGPSCRCTWRKFLLQADTKCPEGRW